MLERGEALPTKWHREFASSAALSRDTHEVQDGMCVA